MLQVIRAIAWLALAVGVSAADSNSLIIPVALAVLGAVLLKLSEMLDKRTEADE